jgi:hypothetical protein
LARARSSMVISIRVQNTSRKGYLRPCSHKSRKGLSLQKRDRRQEKGTVHIPHTKYIMTFASNLILTIDIQNSIGASYDVHR